MTHGGRGRPLPRHASTSYVIRWLMATAVLAVN